MSRVVKLIIAAIAAVVVVVSAGTYIYIHFIEEDAPAELTLDSVDGSTDGTSDSSDANDSAATVTDVNGTWTPTSASQVGYRVKEVLFGQSTEAVGRTNKVTGSAKITSSSISEATFTVDMTSVASDQSRRDGQFQSRIMETDQFPNAVFKLTKPISLSKTPGATPFNVEATGDLTLHGVTKSVTVTLAVQASGSTVKVNGSIPVVFEDYDIANPSFSGVTTEDNGKLELLLVLQKQS